jgi:hypothetical protein
MGGSRTWRRSESGGPRCLQGRRYTGMCPGATPTDRHQHLEAAALVVPDDLGCSRIPGLSFRVAVRRRYSSPELTPACTSLRIHQPMDTQFTVPTFGLIG